MRTFALLWLVVFLPAGVTLAAPEPGPMMKSSSASAPAMRLTVSVPEGPVTSAEMKVDITARNTGPVPISADTEDRYPRFILTLLNGRGQKCKRNGVGNEQFGLNPSEFTWVIRGINAGAEQSWRWALGTYFDLPPDNYRLAIKVTYYDGKNHKLAIEDVRFTVR